MYMGYIKKFAKNEKKKKMEILIQAVRIFSDDIGMKFGTEQ